MLSNIRSGFPEKTPFFTFTVEMTVFDQAGVVHHFGVGEMHKVIHQGGNCWTFEDLPGKPVLVLTDYNLLGVEPT